ncbi:MAG: membrane or secreted protein [Bacteroidetes bacterium HGW-Bacteroidetes-1]|jgi:flagellar basal body-associated protein FliL|nr:MAG: membrane or secreted protein [Bacteroidetes bacterium HGW-Bacteroidetes-1]
MLFVIAIFAKKYTMFLKLILLSVVIIGLALAGLAIKMFVFKNGEFKKQCSSSDAHGNKIGCSCGGGESSCERKSV